MMSEKTFIPILSAGIIILVVGFVGSFLFWINLLNQNKETEMQENNVAALCAEFDEVEGEISCEKAVAIALADTSGEVQNISVRPGINIDTSVSPPIFTPIYDMWMVVIRLQDPIINYSTGEEVEIKDMNIVIDPNTGSIFQRLKIFPQHK